MKDLSSDIMQMCKKQLNSSYKQVRELFGSILWASSFPICFVASHSYNVPITPSLLIQTMKQGKSLPYMDGISDYNTRFVLLG